jgi:hypothetical protein
MKIIGNTVGNVSPNANWNQSDPTKADYIIGKEDVDAAIMSAQDTANQAQDTADQAQVQHKSGRIVLSASGWENKTQTVSVDGVTEDNDVFMSYAKESKEDAEYAEILIYAQSENKLTFTCDTTPTVDIVVHVAIFD